VTSICPHGNPGGGQLGRHHDHASRADLALPLSSPLLHRGGQTPTQLKQRRGARGRVAGLDASSGGVEGICARGGGARRGEHGFDGEGRRTGRERQGAHWESFPYMPLKKVAGYANAIENFPDTCVSCL
jgi:hypothetical protein